MTTPVLLQVSGTSKPDEVLTAMRELPESTARDQDHLVPLVAEVVMLSKLGTLAHITTSLHGLITHSKFGIAACEPFCHCSPTRYLLWPCIQHSFVLTLPLDNDCHCAHCLVAC